MGHDFTLEEYNKGMKRSLKARQNKATIKFENKLIATLQQKEIDKANDIYRKGKIFELLNNLSEHQKKKYVVQKSGLPDKILKSVVKNLFNISIKDKEENA